MVGTVAGIAVLAVFIFLLVPPAKPIKPATSEPQAA